VKVARVPHGCEKEQEGELAVEAPMADRDDQPALGTAGDFYSQSSPRLTRRSMSSVLLHSTVTGLGGRAPQWHARRTAGHLGRVRRGRRCGTCSQGVGAKGNGWLVPRGSGNRANTDAEVVWWPARGARRSQAGRTPGAPSAL
jgi:hypothetical protein